MKKNKIEKFRFEYENKVKKYRDRYYEKIQSKDYKYNTSKINYNAISISITIIISIVILLIFNNITGSIVALSIATLLTLITRYIIKETDNLQNNDFTRTIRKLGYFNIEDYEDKLTEYLTGPCGVYKTELEELKKIYNLDHNSTVLYTQNNNRYYAWNNKDKTILYLLNTKISETPEVKQIPLDKINYYRFDRIRKYVVLKTNIEDFYFTQNSFEELENLLPEKDFYKIKKQSPEETINNFETYILDAKKEIEEKEKICQKKKNIAKNTAVVALIIMITSTILENIIPQLKIISKIAKIIIIIPYINNLSKYYRERFRTPKNEYEITNTLKENINNINQFQELKVALSIENTGNSIYSKDGKQYLTWIKNGYFHLFLNEIYFNVVYIVIKTEDIEYYKEDEKECILKFKNNSLIFKPKAKEVFENLIPNKDYNTINNAK